MGSNIAWTKAAQAAGLTSVIRSGVGVSATADKISVAQLSLRAAWPPSDGQWESAIEDGTVDIELGASSQAIADGIAEVVQWLLS
jgi:hypothetical protein